MRWVRPPRKDDIKEIPDELFDAAKQHLDDDYLLRYFCKKYNRPPHDPLLMAYTPEDMMVEYVADAIEDDRIEIGVDGKPVRKVMHKGVEIMETGSSVFDEYEREWAEQDLDALEDERQRKLDEAFGDDEADESLADMIEDEDNILDMVKERLDSA